MSMDESENTDGNEESFCERCVKELRSDELLLNILNKLEKCNKLNDLIIIIIMMIYFSNRVQGVIIHFVFFSFDDC